MHIYHKQCLIASTTSAFKPAELDSGEIVQHGALLGSAQKTVIFQTNCSENAINLALTEASYLYNSFLNLTLISLCCSLVSLFCQFHVAKCTHISRYPCFKRLVIMTMMTAVFSDRKFCKESLDPIAGDGAHFGIDLAWRRRNCCQIGKLHICSDLFASFVETKPTFGQAWSSILILR